MTDSDEVKLLPCPHCSGNGADVQLEDDGYAYVICVCTAQGPLRKGETEATAAWNTRPPVVTDEVVERVAYKQMESLKNLLGPPSDADIRWAAKRIARDLCASMPAVVSGGQSDG